MAMIIALPTIKMLSIYLCISNNLYTVLKINRNNNDNYRK